MSKLLTEGKTFSVILLPRDDDLKNLNSIRQALHSLDFCNQPKQVSSDCHITLGLGLYREDIFASLKSQLTDLALQFEPFKLVNIYTIEQIKREGGLFLWTGITYQEKVLQELKRKVNNLLVQSNVCLTSEYDDYLKTFYSDSIYKPDSLVGNHISLASNGRIDKQQDIRSYLTTYLPKEILIDRMAIRIYGSDAYLWTSLLVDK